MTIAIAVVFPLAMLLYSNSRVSDAKETLRAETQAFRLEMNARFDRLEGKIDAHIEHMEMRIKLHELEHHPPPKP